MFTGLVEAMGHVASCESQPPGKRFGINVHELAEGGAVGDSVALNGCCLTVVAVEGELFFFEAGEETLSRTNLGRLATGSPVNLERSLQVGDRFGGHLVTGHIDCTGEVVQRTDDAEWSTVWLELPEPWARYLAPKGSISIDGVSLTVVDVQANRFSVALIPHTLQVTNLGTRQPGDVVNLETDLIAKYVESILKHET